MFPGPIWTQPAPGSRRPRFTREQIAEVAIRIADEEGFDALSMRRIADELDAGTMTLYHYVRTKDDLMELMNDTLMAEILISERDLAAGWRHALAQIARASYRSFRRHPWALQALRGARFGPNSLAHFEQSLAAAATAPFSLPGQLDVIGIVDDYVYGHVLRVWEAVGMEEFDAGAPTDSLVEFMTERVRSGAYPHLRALVDTGAPPNERWQEVVQLLNDEHRFERGLAALLDGVARSYARGRSGGGTRPRRAPKAIRPRAQRRGGHRAVTRDRSSKGGSRRR